MTPLRLLQVSDLHTGRNEEPEIEEELRRIAGELDPEVVVVTGDLTHRNRADQHERAGALLRSLGRPLVVIPGNHDIPTFPPRRFARTFAAFAGIWGDAEPSYRSERVVVVGLNSVRAWKYQRGSLRGEQLERVARELAAASATALRVVALHHHLSDAPWRDSKRTVPRRSRTLAALADAGAELVLSGHIHQSSVHDRREVQAEVERSVVLAVAPGLRRPRAWRPAEVGGFHAFEADAATLRVVTYTWHDGRFEPTVERRYARPPAPPT